MAIYNWPNFGVIVTCDGCDLVVNPLGDGCDLIMLGEAADGSIVYAHEDDGCIAEAARRCKLRERAGDE